jgi:hypothetical protein
MSDEVGRMDAAVINALAEVLPQAKLQACQTAWTPFDKPAAVFRPNSTLQATGNRQQATGNS